MNEPLWVIGMMAMDSTPGRPRDAFAAALRVIAEEVERRGERQQDLDPGETADWLRAEADLAELPEVVSVKTVGNWWGR